MFGNSGFTSGTTPIGSPYLETGPIGAGASITVTIEFTRTGTQPIAYSPRLLGEGVR